MSEPINDGGPAFPVGIPEGVFRGHGAVIRNGMTLRDWFAGQALQALDFQKALDDAIAEGVKVSEAGPVIAEDCYKMADAMIKVRDEKP